MFAALFVLYVIVVVGGNDINNNTYGSGLQETVGGWREVSRAHVRVVNKRAARRDGVTWTDGLPGYSAGGKNTQPPT